MSMQVPIAKNIPKIKSAHSPTNEVAEKGNLIKILITTVNTPPIGPKVKPQIKAGKSERWISKKGGKNGSGKLRKYSITASAENIPSLAMLDAVKKFFINATL